jgi:hypothetical protein
MYMLQVFQNMVVPRTLSIESRGEEVGPLLTCAGLFTTATRRHPVSRSVVIQTDCLAPHTRAADAHRFMPLSFCRLTGARLQDIDDETPTRGGT